MDPLPDVPASLARWLDGALPALLGLLAGFLGARLIGSGRRHPGAAAGRVEDRVDGNQDREQDRDRRESRDDEMRALLGRLEQENRYLEQALAHRGADIQLLTARMGEAAARDREELVHLQDELEAEHRIGVEKARLIRSLDAASRRAEARMQEVEAARERQRVSVAALQAALAHAKRAQASTERRLAGLREQLRVPAPMAARATGADVADVADTTGATSATEPTERIVERIVEVPVERIVYREVPVEVPIEVPVGFTVLPTPAAGGLRPRYSEKRPSST
jgi:hypothetical protein